MWIDPIFEPFKTKTSHEFSVMLLTENELIGSLAEADLQAINLNIKKIEEKLREIASTVHKYCISTNNFLPLN